MLPLLLPVRLETRFTDSARSLRVRVIPDDPWFDDHDPSVGDSERADLESWANASRSVSAAQAELDAAPHAERDRPAARLQREQRRLHGAWQRLVDRRGAARARWLVATYPDGDVAGSERGEGGRLRTVFGFPERLEVWLLPKLGRDGVRHTEAAPRLVLNPQRERLALDLPDAELRDPAGRRWWNSYAAAVEVGMAGEFLLDDRDRAALPFEALVVVGLGSERASALFRAHQRSGKLAMLAPGTPTNTIMGGATPVPDADPTDPETAPVSGDSLLALSRLLFGNDTQLTQSHVAPGAAASGPAQNAVVKALWPALWGHSLSSMWATGDATHDIAQWAAHGLRPEGALPPIRIGDQPYGVLPCTDLAALVADTGWHEPEVLRTHVIARLRRARTVWSRAAAADGNVVRASASKLMSFAGRTPVSAKLYWRKLVPHDVVTLLRLAEGESPTAAEENSWWDEIADEVATFGLLPWRRMTALYGARRLELPLVVPDGSTAADAADALGALLATLAVPRFDPEPFADPEALSERMGTSASVLLQVARISLQLALADDGRVRLGEDPPTIDHLFRARLGRWIAAAQEGGDSAQARTLQAVRDGIERLSQVVREAPDTVERVLRGAFDCASYRLDAWLSAPATFRLAGQLDSASGGGTDTSAVLGAYGWVDKLAPGGGGPTAGGAILAPSQAQAITAAVLRDRHLRAREQGTDTWHMNVTSGSARQAKRLADTVRAGLHPATALGMALEARVDDGLRIEQLRRRFPARIADNGQRICDGLAIIDALKTEPNLWDDSEGMAVTARLKRELGAVVDTYGDLAVADAVHRVVSGRGATAGGALDAAAGLGPPTQLEVLNAQATGHHLTTVALAMIPLTPLPAEPTPAELVDPSVAALVDARYRTRDWRWQFEVTGPQISETTQVLLADLGLGIADALVHRAVSLENIARWWIMGRMLTEHGVAARDLHFVLTDSPGSAVHAQACRFVQMLGSRPMTLADVSGGAAGYDPTPAAATHAREVGLDVLQRCQRVAAALRRMFAALASGTPSAETVRAAMLWGGVRVPDATGLAALATALGQRLKNLNQRLVEATVDAEAAVPVPPEVADWDFATIADHVIARVLARVSLADLTELLMASVAPEGQLAVMTPMTVTAESPFPSLVAANTNPAVRDWLSTVAAVRPPLARADAELLGQALEEGADSIRLMTSHPHDPWQKVAAVAVDARGEIRTGPPPMLVAITSQLADVRAGTSLAVGMVDRFAETVPENRRPPSVAFGFDAPGARAPQALLACVSPTASSDWTPDGRDLLAQVLDARILARVRMVLPENRRIAALGALLPTAAVPLAGAAAIQMPEPEEEA